MSPQDINEGSSSSDIVESGSVVGNVSEENENNAEEMLDPQEGSSSALLGSDSFRERVSGHIGLIGRHFNILDRLFKKQTDLGGSHGASYDGVFSNLTAKPNTDNNGHEILDEDVPPSYDVAANDIVPSYYGVHTEGSAMYYDEICIEGLPIGNVANLIWNIIVSTSFQFIGFLITYVLHTSHAAKQGSRFGLGLTFISYSYSMIPNDLTSKVGKNNVLERVQVENPNDYENIAINPETSQQDTFKSTLNHGIEEEKQNLPFLAVIIGLLGIYISLKSLIDYAKMKKMEQKYLAQDQV